jgi:hypothetical protein
MLMQSGSLSALKVAQKEGNSGPVGFPFELDAGNFPFPLIFTMHNVEHVFSFDAESPAARLYA